MEKNTESWGSKYLAIRLAYLVVGDPHPKVSISLYCLKEIFYLLKRFNKHPLLKNNFS